MHLYLDTSDYINLLERPNENNLWQALAGGLALGEHTLIYSFPLVVELADPLWSATHNTSVTRTLDALESMRHTWIDFANIPSREVQQALNCIREGCDYCAIDPFVEDFVSTFPNLPRLAKFFYKKSIGAPIFDLWFRSTFNPQQQKRRLIATYRELIRQEREIIKNRPKIEAERNELFITKLEERIHRNGLLTGQENQSNEYGRRVAEHVFQHPHWCPAIRLGFEMFHSIAGDITDKLQDGDLWDFVHAGALPYADVFRCDGRILNHIERVDRGLGTNYADKVKRDIAGVLNEIRPNE